MGQCFRSRIGVVIREDRIDHQLQFSVADALGARATDFIATHDGKRGSTPLSRRARAMWSAALSFAMR
ncbi:MAG: hypothetical protein EON61_02460 [Alphaproteobacteria bacterium]|nr:MAG: hypothetical protein EON61_02460 [Alphaproteobacteria bacterium]